MARRWDGCGCDPWADGERGRAASGGDFLHRICIHCAARTSRGKRNMFARGIWIGARRAQMFARGMRSGIRGLSSERDALDASARNADPRATAKDLRTLATHRRAATTHRRAVDTDRDRGTPSRARGSGHAADEVEIAEDPEVVVEARSEEEQALAFGALAGSTLRLLRRDRDGHEARERWTNSGARLFLRLQMTLDELVER